MVVEDLVADTNHVRVQSKKLHLVLRVEHPDRDTLHSARDEHWSLRLRIAVKVIVAIFVQVSRLRDHLLLNVDRVSSVPVHLLLRESALGDAVSLVDWTVE